MAAVSRGSGWGSGWHVLWIAVALGGCLAVGQAVHRNVPVGQGGLSASSTAAASSTAPELLAAYLGQVRAILARSQRDLAEGDRLLAAHDADPTLAGNAGWLQDHARVVAALESDDRALQALRPPGEAAATQACLDDGLRLAWTGHALLHRAFAEDGHAAYYFGAHGNWDLNLAANRLAACQVLQATG